MEKSTIELLTEYNIDPKNTAIKQYYNADNLWRTLHIERDENKHSAFLAWLLGHDVEGANSPLIMLLNLLVMRSVAGQMDEHLKMAILKAGLMIKSATVNTEVAVSRLSALPSNDRLDIYANCDVEGVEDFARLEIIIENKVGALEGKEKSKKFEEWEKGRSQTQRYYYACHENRKDDSATQLFVFLTAKEQSSIDDHFIKISYQDLVDYILEPYINRSGLDDHTVMAIKEYLRILGNPYNKNNTILATTMEEKELLKDFYMRNETLFKRAIDVMIETSTDDEERNDFEELKKVINRTSHGHRNYLINGTGNYSMYQVIEVFAKYLMQNGKSIQDVDDICKQYSKASKNWVLLSDDKTKVYRYQYERDGKTYPHYHKFSFNGKEYFSMKEWGGDEKGKFTKLMEGINNNYPSFQIEEIN